MDAAFFRRDDKVDVIREENQPDLVVVPNRAEREQARHLRRQLPLAQMHAAKFPRRADIHHQHHRQLPLLGELLHVSRAMHLAVFRGHVPINRSHLVARLIFAHLLEVHPAAFENAAVLAGERGRDQAARLELEALDFFEDVAGGFQRGVISDR